jgi:hypothetical protein
MIIIGLAYPKLQELGPAKVSGDFCLERGEVKFYLPITTAILASC